MNKEDQEYFVKLGKRLQYLRTKRNYSLSEIARHIGVAKQTVGAYEQGISRIQVHRLYKLSLLYKINLIEFFVDVEEEIPDFHNPKYESKFNIKVDKTHNAIVSFHNKLQKQLAEVSNIKDQLEEEYGDSNEVVNDFYERDEKKEA